MELNTPVEEGVSLKVTVVVGVIFVPPLVSVTVAVHVVTALRSTSLELQLTVVEVVRWVTVRLKVFELPV